MTPRKKILMRVEEIAKIHDVDLASILSQSRVRKTCRARQHAFYVVRKGYGLSFPQIGRIFGRDHTTIIAGIGAYIHRSDILDSELDHMRRSYVANARRRARTSRDWYYRQKREAA